MTHGYRSKTVASWLAFLGGGFGLHRFYLHGLTDVLGWAWAAVTLVGLQGLRLHLEAGQDHHGAWLLLPVLGLSLSAGALMALVYGLMPDERWNARHNPDGPAHESGWLTVAAVVLALLVGAGVLMSAIAFGAQRYFEYTAEGAAAQGNSEKLSQ